MEKFQVSKAFVQEAYNAACSEWKAKIEREFPELHGAELIRWKWYMFRGREDYLLVCKDVAQERGDGFWGGGYMSRHNSTEGYYNLSTSQGVRTRAPQHVVQKKLIQEAKRRGYKTGNYVPVAGCHDTGELILDECFFCPTDNTLYTRPEGEGGNVLYRNGVWAEIGITLAEAEKRLGTKIIL